MYRMNEWNVCLFGDWMNVECSVVCCYVAALPNRAEQWKWKKKNENKLFPFPSCDPPHRPFTHKFVFISFIHPPFLLLLSVFSFCANGCIECVRVSCIECVNPTSLVTAGSRFQITFSAISTHDSMLHRNVLSAPLSCFPFVSPFCSPICWSLAAGK